MAFARMTNTSVPEGFTSLRNGRNHFSGCLPAIKPDKPAAVIVLVAAAVVVYNVCNHHSHYRDDDGYVQKRNVFAPSNVQAEDAWTIFRSLDRVP